MSKKAAGLIVFLLCLGLGPALSLKLSPSGDSSDSDRFLFPAALRSSSYAAIDDSTPDVAARTEAAAPPATAASTAASSATAAASGSTQDAFTSQFNKAMLTLYRAKIRLDLEQAVREFLAARSLNPLSPEVHYNLGLIYLELDEYAEAVDSFSEYLRLARSAEDADRASSLLASARGLQLWLERSRRAMLNPRAWRLLDHAPAEVDTDWFKTEFRQTKNGQLQMRNPRYNYDLLAREGETKRNPWLTLNIKGRRFYYEVCLMRENSCQKGFGYVLVEGELLLVNGRTLVIARMYSIPWKSYVDEYYEKGDLYYKRTVIACLEQTAPLLMSSLCKKV